MCGLLLGNEVWVDDGGDEHGQVSYHGSGKNHVKRKKHFILIRICRSINEKYTINSAMMSWTR